MNVQTVKLSDDTIDFILSGLSRGLEVPKSAQQYIQVVDQTLALQTTLLNSSRNYKILALASLTILTGLAFIPVGLPVIAVGAVFASYIAINSVVSIHYNKKSIKLNKELFSVQLCSLEKEILQKFLVDLPKIFDGKYETTNEEGTTKTDQFFIAPRTYIHKSMTLKQDIDLEELKDQLRKWKEQSRAIHSFSIVNSRMGIILPRLTNPSTEQEKIERQLHYFFNSTILTNYINTISNGIEKILNGEESQNITDLINSLDQINRYYHSLQTICPNLEEIMELKIEQPSSSPIQLIDPRCNERKEPSITYTPVITRHN